LPFVLLLLDYWPLERLFSRVPISEKKSQPGRLGRLATWVVWEKLPLLALAGASSALTWYAQQHGQAIQSLEDLPFTARLANAVMAYWQYLGKTVWPARLAAFYPHLGLSYSAGYALIAGLALAAISIGVVLLSRRLPYLFVGWFWYVGTLVPVIGLVQVGIQGMADRYTYVPLIGIFIAAVWGATDFASSKRRRVVAAFLSACLLAVYMLYSFLQVSYWHDGVTLWRHTLEVTKDNAYAHDGLGGAYVKEAAKGGQRAQQDWTDAVQEYRAAVAIKPGFVKAWKNLAGALIRQKTITGVQEAEAIYRQMLRANPGNAGLHHDLGIALQVQKRHEEAAREFREAIHLDPDVIDDSLTREQVARYLFNYGLTLAQRGKLNEASEFYLLAAKLDPGQPTYRRTLDETLEKLRSAS
jgi:tetratricopeptide (TPR) repeat protein